jgi:hypothetical protein
MVVTAAPADVREPQAPRAVTLTDLPSQPSSDGARLEAR